jgi:hypothetical protein
MKNFLLAITAVLALTCCSKDEDNSSDPTIDYPTSKVYTSTNGTLLVLHSAEWYLTKSTNGFAEVHLKIAGLTNGNKLTIENYGDGLIDDVDVEQDSKKNFTKDIVICFYATTVPPGEFELSTTIKVYRGSDILTVDLKSGKLKF